MPGNDLTRRSVLALLAGTGAASAVDPTGAIAGLLASPVQEPRLLSIDLGALGAGVRTVTAPRPFELAGLQWSEPAAARIEIRALLGGGRFGGFVQAAAAAHRPDGQEARQAGERGFIGEPVWVGRSQTLQLRLAQPVRGLRLHLVELGSAGARPDPAATSAAALPLAEPVLEAGPGQPPIIARRAWAGNDSPPRVAPQYGHIELGFVHHTLNPNGYAAAEVPAIVRAIYIFHRDVNGWNDIGYNFVLDRFGRIFEARAGGIDEPVAGAQAGGYNFLSTGVAVLGDFQEALISQAAKQALVRLLAWKLSLHGVPVQGQVVVRVDPAGAVYSRFPAGAKVSLPRIAGHRDADSTECPGNTLYEELPAIRRAAAALAGTPASLSIQLQAAPPSANGGTTEAQPAPEGEQPRLLAGRLVLLDGSPLAGAPIEVQARSVSHRGEVVQERTLATVSTDPEGGWSLPVFILHPQALHPRYGGQGKGRRRMPEPTLALRALLPGGSGLPAAVSPPLELEGSPSLSA